MTDQLGVNLDAGGEEGYIDVAGCNIVLPPGRYEVRYCYYETGQYRDQAKVTVHFAVVSPEEYAGTPLERFYNVERLAGPPKRYGNFKAKGRGHLVRELSCLLGCPDRTDRLSFAGLKGKQIACEVETVVRDGDRLALPSDQQYSRIKRLIEVIPDDPWE